ncbi:hypothetical protein WJX81_003126 [Elliptochloris bilobata]|uniref:Ysc84 actin-binding domain-containing protein n=1 Tax=Elliptochloris bilobata TaxID=381761 RepID=A0AAW1S019_9CHLO
MEKIRTLLANAAALLQDLTVDKLKETKIPPSEFRKCAGVAFVFSYKAGLIVSFQHGQGFLLRKLGEQSGAQTRWSAPLLFTVNAAGAGATLGVSEIASVIVLDTPEACDAFLKTQVTLDAELGAAAGSHGGQVDVMAANVTCPRESFHSFSYSRVSRGLMVDVSWNGVGVRVDNDANELLYGDGVAPAAILHGGVAQPLNLMAPLLKVLANLRAFSPFAALSHIPIADV